MATQRPPYMLADARALLDQSYTTVKVLRDLYATKNNQPPAEHEDLPVVMTSNAILVKFQELEIEAARLRTEIMEIEEGIKPSRVTSMKQSAERIGILTERSSGGFLLNEDGSPRVLENGEPRELEG